MIYAIGDSHALFTFKGMPGVEPHNHNGLTMQRVGHPDDQTIPVMLERLLLEPGDTVIFCCGEIDVRRFVKPYLEHHSKATMDGLLNGWARAYIRSLGSYDLRGARPVVMSVIPPTREVVYLEYNSKPHHKNNEFGEKANAVIPWAGTDAERAAYTLALNGWLKCYCEDAGWPFLNVYTGYVDADGMLTCSDGSVHIGDTTNVKALVEEL